MAKYNFKPLNHKLIDSYAIEITKKLQKAGHETYLVGGCVRDLLLNRSPKDFDISTTARPRQIKRLISNSYIIGRRFKLVLAKKAEIQYEISTFRRNLLPGEDPEALPSGDNIFGSAKQDAHRRDYTCNALFYDPVKKVIHDHTQGIQDLYEGWIKLIGSPEDRLPEDPIRILRALRFSGKLNLQVESSLKQGLQDYAEELISSPIPRKREEYLKILRLRDPSLVFYKLSDLEILKHTLPTMSELLNSPEKFRQFIFNLNSFDKKLRKILDTASLFGVLIVSLIQASQPELPPEEYLQSIQKDKIQKLMKHELGVFNTEVTHIEQAFRLTPALFGFETLDRKGARKKAGLLLQKALPLSLVCHNFFKGPDLCHWLDLYQNFDFKNEELLFNKSNENND